jgi:ferredoxin
MKLHLTGSKDRMTRREFLGIRRRKNVKLIIDKEKCTGCGLCMVGCPTRALNLSRGVHQDTYQIFFTSALCDACGICETSCPENCIQLQQGIEENTTDRQIEVVFKDEFCHCIGCGTPLFPEAMLKNLETKIFAAGKPTWSFNLCPSCRFKSQFEGKRIGESKT